MNQQQQLDALTIIAAEVARLQADSTSDPAVRVACEQAMYQLIASFSKTEVK